LAPARTLAGENRASRLKIEIKQQNEFNLE
jgi:hypothetical protein